MKNLIILEGNAFDGVQGLILVAMVIIGILIIIVSLVSFVISIGLAISYIKYNRKKNSVGLSGEEVCRRILDDNGLNHIKVSKTGSLLFGNSYSHYFKKVRLRRLTYKKKSITSLAMAGQKASLAILDKENDPDMKKRVKLTPIVVFGPFAFIPIILVGFLIDVFIFNCSGIVTVISIVLGLLFYIYAFILSLMELKTEKKAQNIALEILANDGLTTEEEREMMKQLFRLYNIEYVNNMILALLELIYSILEIALRIVSNSSSSSKK